MSSNQCSVISEQWPIEEQVSLADIPEAIFHLAANEIHVWYAGLEHPSAMVSALARSLFADEQQRAGSFHFERDRQRFIVRRGLLRHLLGRYLDIDPAQISLICNPDGKPLLATADSIHFNLSHAHERVVYAITRACPVGIDLEYIRPIDEADLIVERFFTADERAHYHALPAAQRLDWFFACWTQKEARYKASGRGLFALEETASDEDFPRLVQTFQPAPGYIATLAIAGPEHLLSANWQVQLRSLSLSKRRHFESLAI